MSDAPHDARDRLSVLRTIDAGNAETDRVWADVPVTERLFHDSVQDLLHAELAHDLQVGAGASRFGQDLPAIVREQAHGLGTARVDAQHVHTSGSSMVHSNSPMERRVSVMASGIRFARPVICSCLVVLVVAIAQVGTRAADAPLRTFWVTRASLDSPETIRRAVATAAVGGFDTVMVPVGLMAETSPAFDGALEMVKEARDRGLRVHAWIEVTLAAAAGELPGVS